MHSCLKDKPDPENDKLSERGSQELQMKHCEKPCKFFSLSPTQDMSESDKSFANLAKSDEPAENYGAWRVKSRLGNVNPKVPLLVHVFFAVCPVIESVQTRHFDLGVCDT